MGDVATVVVVGMPCIISIYKKLVLKKIKTKKKSAIAHIVI